MELSFLDIAVFLTFITGVVGLGIFKSRKEKTSEDYFLAGRGLNWGLIGVSLIAANISTEQFVGMSGAAAGAAGLAIASYEWMAAITLVFVAIFFLPRFLRSGIYTIPEYLEYRYNSTARSIMAFYMLVIYIGVTISAVIYSGGITINTIFAGNELFGIPLTLKVSIWLTGITAAIYVTCGGLKACAWADLIQGSALIIGGAIVLIFGFKAVGGVQTFFQANEAKMHMILPSDHPVLPWTALIIGLWIPHFYYWGLNQYITQRTLAAKSLRQGQLGILFAAGLKLIIPFVIVIPGIMALQLYGSQMTGEGGTTDAAYPLLIRNLIPMGLRGFMFAAIAGAVMSSLASMLNSASTIFTMDMYKRHWKKDASQKSLVLIGRIMTVVFVVIGCFIAPKLGDPRFKGIFNYIQEFQGYISPGILAAFVFGMIFKRTPPAAGVTALVLTVPIYGFLQWKFSGNIAFLNRMAITLGVLFLVMAIITAVKPLKEPRVMPVKEGLDMKPAASVVWLGAAIIVATLALYAIFW